MGSMADFSIITICERSRALADGKVVLEGQIRGNVDFESHCKRAGELHLQEWPRPACYIAVATFRTRLMQGRVGPFPSTLKVGQIPTHQVRSGAGY